MKDELAEHLLATVMGWNPDSIARERPIIQVLAAYSYDGYEQFSTGSRFVENLALWLNQFETAEERNTAYSFIKTCLVFISQREMWHLVEITFPEVISEILYKRISIETSIPRWRVAELNGKEDFALLLRQSLFLALSDGSHIDHFRRCNSAIISQEQILRSHEISASRASKAVEALEADLRKALKREPLSIDSHFREIFLMDDFSGSGMSYLRRSEDKHELEGKIANFYDSVCKDGAPLSYIVNRKDIRVHLVLYMATKKAEETIAGLGKELFGPIPFDVNIVYPIPDAVKVERSAQPGFLSLAEKYYDNKIETLSYKKGRHEFPYLGFDEGSLPLVLFHNTPNNSLPLIWFGEYARYRGCFPRVSRFRESK